MQNTKIINIEDVSLKTMQVEIKALTLNGKQMTLSIFRQLPKVSIFDQTGNLKGVPWGKVNYFWKGCEGEIHIIWQKDNQLFRSCEYNASYELIFKQEIHEAALTGWQLEDMEHEVLKLEKIINNEGSWPYKEEEKELAAKRRTEVLEKITLQRQKKETLDSAVKLKIENYKQNFQNLKNLDQLFIAA